MIGGFYEPPKQDEEPGDAAAPLLVIAILGVEGERPQGGDGPLTPVKGKPAIRRVAEAAVRSKVKTVLVVVGGEAEAVGKALEGLDVRVLVNEQPQKGQASYVTAALEAVSEDAEAVLFLPGSLAAIEPHHINAVVDAWAASRKSIVIPAYEGKPGHPILIGRYYFLDALALSEEAKPLRELAELHEDETHYVAVDSPAVLWDLSDPEGLDRASKLLRD